jgi:hypothetical protein
VTPPDNESASGSAEEPQFQPVWSRELKPPAADRPWLWHGYLAPGAITMLVSQWKTGKTTFVSVLLARRASGGSLAGRALRPGRTALVCEESRDHWEERRRTLDFGDGVAFFCQPLGCCKPTPTQWLGLIDSIARLAAEGVDLAVIDPLASFLPSHAESNTDLMLEALLPLGRLCSLGMAVLLLHHPKKGHVLAGQAARGVGSLSGHVDIIIEMSAYPKAADDDRRRLLRAWSRFAATPRLRVIEWRADGSDYLDRGVVVDEEFRLCWEQLAVFLAAASDKLTRREIRALWPAGRDRPSEQTLWRWLERAVAEQLLRRDGTGHRNSPFRYWLPAREAEWAQDPMWRIIQEDEAVRAELLRRMNRPR